MATKGASACLNGLEGGVSLLGWFVKGRQPCRMAKMRASAILDAYERVVVMQYDCEVTLGDLLACGAGSLAQGLAYGCMGALRTMESVRTVSKGLDRCYGMPGWCWHMIMDVALGCVGWGKWSHDMGRDGTWICGDGVCGLADGSCTRGSTLGRL